MGGWKNRLQQVEFEPMPGSRPAGFLTALPISQRVVVVLYYRQRFSAARNAEALEIPRGNCQVNGCITGAG